MVGRRHPALVLSLVLRGCAAASATPTPEIVYVTPPATALPTPAPTWTPTTAPTVEPTLTPPRTPAPARTQPRTPDPTATSATPTEPPPATGAPVAEVTPDADERRIIAGIRADVRDHCQPRRDDLPPGTVAAVECTPPSALVDRVGFYLFEDKDAMVETYLARLESEGVEQDSGDCAAGEEGEMAETPFADDPWDAPHAGCVVNEQGYANIRWTVPDGPLYGGVLGDTDDMADLYDWSQGGEATRGETPRVVDLWNPDR